MEQSGLERLTCYFATGDDVSGGFFDGGVSGFDRELRLFVTTLLCFIFLCFIQDYGDQTFGFNFRGRGGGEIGFHGCVAPVSSAGRELGKSGRRSVLAQST